MARCLLARGSEQQLAGEADAAADDNEVGVEGVDCVSDRDAQAPSQQLHRSSRAGVAVARCVDDRARGMPYARARAFSAVPDLGVRERRAAEAGSDDRVAELGLTPSKQERAGER